MEIIKQISLNGVQLRVTKGDITESDADAIVNAANSHLQHGGGVAGAIARKGGPIIQEESNKIGYTPVGTSAVTTAGRLKAKCVIHTVGPRWGEGDEKDKLRRAVRSALKIATEKGFTGISMPAISGGIFGFPKEECAGIIVEETVRFVKGESTALREIDFCLMDEEMVRLFVKSFDKWEQGK
jgi:O-acetyl-ADP-ribose deacetylase